MAHPTPSRSARSARKVTHRRLREQSRSANDRSPARRRSAAAPHPRARARVRVPPRC